MTVTKSTDRRDWDWDRDGALETAHYVGTRQVTIKNGPSAGQEKLIFDFEAGLDDEAVSVWSTTVLRSKLHEELKARGADDFEPGELFTITPLGKKKSANGTYHDFDVVFEHAAPTPTTAELLSRTEERPFFESDEAV